MPSVAISRLPKVPLAPPMAVGPLTLILPEPVCVALFEIAVDTVMVVPPSFSVPEVSVSVGIVGSVPDKVTVPADLLTTTLFNDTVAVPLVVQVCAPEPLSVRTVDPLAVNVVDAWTLMLPPTDKLRLLVLNVGVLPVLMVRLLRIVRELLSKRAVEVPLTRFTTRL